MDSKKTTTINSLPDDIICHILSFLPTDQSVRTRVLSTRWKHLYSFVPVLDFYLDFDCDSTSSSLIGTGTSTHTDSDSLDRVERFLDFVDWVFNTYKAHPVYKFQFKSRKKFQDSSRLHSWISKLVRLGVCKVDFYMHFKVPQTFPHDIFNCKTLIHLKIFGNFVLNVPDSACLPCVHNIVLFGVSFITSDSAKRLFRCCLVLEHLTISLSRCEDIQVVDISVPTLKSVALLHNQNDSRYIYILNTPNLEWIEYVGDITYGIYKGFKSLTEAFIELPVHFHDMYKYNLLENLFRVVSHVRVLHITTSTMEALRRSGRSLPIFHNLTRWELKVNSSFDSGFILHLLSVMPNLEVFVVDNGNFVNENSQLFPENVPECVSLRLKEVRFEGFFMMEYEFKLVEYFLKNAKVLDTLKIKSKGSVENQLEMSTELLTYPRYSRSCKIVLS